MPKRLYPPHYLVLSIVAIIALDALVSVSVLEDAMALWLGVGLLIFSLGVTVSAARLFSKAGTGIVPFSESTSLVISGAYRYTRNPMYLGMFLCLVSVSLIVNNLLGLLVLLVFFRIIRDRFVIKEEAQMEETFGADYLAFKQKVRRWI
jgi:protein-S-isoprenylcysteine O-methyltransferase Ste14